LSWSQERSVAEDFFKGRAGLYAGGTVLLEAQAPPEAILMLVPDHGDHYGEAEVVVDRRRLKDVGVLDRLSNGDLELGPIAGFEIADI
jgi:hypothetical protein